MRSVGLQPLQELVDIGADEERPTLIEFLVGLLRNSDGRVEMINQLLDAFSQ